jgi:hypothetical protein
MAVVSRTDSILEYSYDLLAEEDVYSLISIEQDESALNGRRVFFCERVHVILRNRPSGVALLQLLMGDEILCEVSADYSGNGYCPLTFDVPLFLGFCIPYNQLMLLSSGYNGTSFTVRFLGHYGVVSEVEAALQSYPSPLFLE